MKEFFRYNFFFFTALVISIGCKPVRNLCPPEYSIDKLNKVDFLKLNGTYNNRQDTAFGQIIHQPYGENQNNRTLIDRLFVFFPDKAYEKDVSVKIKFISKKKAIVYGYQNDQIFFSKKIRGKFKKGYFYIRPKVYLIPFFPVFYMHNFERIRIGKQSNNLIIDHSIRMWGIFLIVGGADKGISTSIYKTLEK